MCVFSLASLPRREGGKPHKMDPTSLRTEGEADTVLGQALEVPQMAAHYRVVDSEDPAEKRLVAFSIEAQAGMLSGNVNKCCFYEWDAAGKQAARQTFGVPDATFGFFHDCLVTENWYMLVQNPTALDLPKLLSEVGRPALALAPGGWQIGYVTYPAPACHQLNRVLPVQHIVVKSGIQPSKPIFVVPHTRPTPSTCSRSARWRR
jgi:carotenoid cleavage dioxygenase-like enzyme